MAHYDSATTAPGARDNTASVAILLEIAHCLKKGGAIPNCELRLVFLGSEENGIIRSVTSACEELYGWRPAVFYHGESDRVPFQNAGLEAANACWRHIEDGRPMLPPCYHSMEDTPKDLD